MIVGTAGHIDHGKTTLVKALTGVDADRLPEEKARGITLDLGYAYVPLPSGDVLGFVDVPGHERLVHNMLAGATGVDFALLVVAADDGPMPQTREHMELLDLLDIRRGAVALTKVDAVAPDRLAAAEAEVAALLAGTALAGAPVFAVSGLTGTGIPALRAYLQSEAAGVSHRPTGGVFRLAVDRVFSLAGVGTVVTGTVHSGRVRPNDALAVAPAGLPVRVRSLRVQDRPAGEGRAGQRCALGLAGVEKVQVTRGDWVVGPAMPDPVRRFQAEIRVPAGGRPLDHWTPVHVHLGAADLMGRIALLQAERLEPGQSALAEILLERETLALRGDRFVLRDTSASRTVAGGRVLDIFPPGRHKRSAERLAYLAALGTDDPAAALVLALARQPAGVPLDAFAANWNLDTTSAADLWRRLDLVAIAEGPTLFGYARTGWESLGQRLLAALAAEHERAPDMQGVERERLRRLTLPTLPRAAFDRLLEEKQSAGLVARSGAWLHLPEHRVELSAADADLWRVLRPLLDATPYGPPRVRDVGKASGTPEEVVRRLFKRAARCGLLYPVAHDHYFTTEAVATLAGIVAELCAREGAARAAAVRDRIGGGRKVAIHILEFFDRVGYTRRVRDDHVVRQAGAASPWTMS